MLRQWQQLLPLILLHRLSMIRMESLLDNLHLKNYIRKKLTKFRIEKMKLDQLQIMTNHSLSLARKCHRRLLHDPLIDHRTNHSKSGQARVAPAKIKSVALTEEITKEWRSRSMTWTRFRIKSKAKCNKILRMSTK